jgi:hypothetical protein
VSSDPLESLLVYQGNSLTEIIVSALTSLATFYIPLSFASSILGMNVKEISTHTTPLWIYFVIAIPLTVLSLLVVGNWDTAVKTYKAFFGQHWRDQFRRRKWKRSLKTSAQASVGF